MSHFTKCRTSLKNTLPKNSLTLIQKEHWLQVDFVNMHIIMLVLVGYLSTCDDHMWCESVSFQIFCFNVKYKRNSNVIILNVTQTCKSHSSFAAEFICLLCLEQITWPVTKIANQKHTKWQRSVPNFQNEY